MQKKIAEVSPAALGQLMLEFEDATKQIVHPAATMKRTSRRPASVAPGCHEHVMSGPQTGALKTKA